MITKFKILCAKFWPRIFVALARWFVIVCAAVATLVAQGDVATHAQAQASPAPQSFPAAQPTPGGPLASLEAQPPSISLSPAVVMARGAFGQGLTQTLTLSNQTSAEFVFDLVAEDVVVKNGQRVYVPAGETPRSIAATAVFSQKTVIVQPYTSSSVDVRLTIPPETGIRAMVAVFRGTNRLQTSSSAVGVTASLGALLTFNLTDNVKLNPDAVLVKPATATSNMIISQWIANAGTEPALLEGTAVVLNASGALTGKTVFPIQRLLPGERLEFAAEYPEQLPPGSYRTLCSFQFEGKTITSEGAFKVP